MQKLGKKTDQNQLIQATLITSLTCSVLKKPKVAQPFFGFFFFLISLIEGYSLLWLGGKKKRNKAQNMIYFKFTIHSSQYSIFFCVCVCVCVFLPRTKMRSVIRQSCRDRYLKGGAVAVSPQPLVCWSASLGTASWLCVGRRWCGLPQWSAPIITPPGGRSSSVMGDPGAWPSFLLPTPQGRWLAAAAAGGGWKLLWRAKSRRMCFVYSLGWKEVLGHSWRWWMCLRYS